MKSTDGGAKAHLAGRHFPVLDWMRACAALAVFAHHLSQQYAAHLTSAGMESLLSHLGAWGVSLFFVLSGFCIHWSRLSPASGRAPFSVGQYASRRFFRIYPAFLVCLLLSYGLGNALGSNLLQPSSWHDVLQHLMLTSSFSPDHRVAVNNVLWSVVAEMHFYVLYGLMPWAFSSRRRALLTSAVALAVGAATYAWSVLAFPSGPDRVMVQHLFLATWWTWCLGVLVAEYMARSRVAGPESRNTALLVMLLVMSLAMCWLPARVALQLQRFVLPLLSAGVLIFALRSSLRYGRVRSLMMLGSMSYSLYLFHPIAILICVHWVAAVPVAVAVAFLSGLMMAYLGYRFIELPGMRLRGYLAAHWRLSGATVAAS